MDTTTLLAKTEKTAEQSKKFKMTWRCVLAMSVLLLASLCARGFGAVEVHWAVEVILVISVGLLSMIYVGGQAFIDAAVAVVVGWLGKK